VPQVQHPAVAQTITETPGRVVAAARVVTRQRVAERAEATTPSEAVMAMRLAVAVVASLTLTS